MLLYKITIPDEFQEKFENFINNVNAVNSKKTVKIKSKEKVAAEPKGEN